MKYVVTGGAGFIGSHICEELSKQGHNVYSIDDYSAGYEKNLNDFDVEQISWDVTEYSGLLSIIKSLGTVDGIFHEAASKKNICLARPERDLQVNIKGAFNVATIAKELDIKLVHASTGSVYGEAMGKQDEKHPTNPVSYYGISKLAGEKYAQYIANAVILRYFHVYGARQESADDRGGVLSIWMRRIEQGLPVILYGDGTQERSFTYVKDLVMANILAMEKGTGIYNAASGYCYTLNDMLIALKNVYGDFEVIQKDWQVGDIKKFYVDNTRIKDLGLTDWTHLVDGLKAMVK